MRKFSRAIFSALNSGCPQQLFEPAAHCLGWVKAGIGFHGEPWVRPWLNYAQYMFAWLNPGIQWIQTQFLQAWNPIWGILKVLNRGGGIQIWNISTVVLSDIQNLPRFQISPVLVAYTFFALSDDAPSKKIPCSHIPKKLHLKLVGRPATEL